MAKNTALGPLSIGNVVSAGLRIYRDHFKSYFTLAFQAYCWLFIPIFGVGLLLFLLAFLRGYPSIANVGSFSILILPISLLVWIFAGLKFYIYSTVISCLAYYEILEKPQIISDVRRAVKSKKWGFLRQFLILVLIYLGVLLVLISIWIFLASMTSTLLGSNNPIFYLLSSIFFVAFAFLFSVLVAQLFVANLSLAIEDNMTATGAISRSWTLTQGSMFRILGVLLITFLVTFPLWLLIQIVSSIIQSNLSMPMNVNSPVLITIYIIVSLLMGILNGALFLPFWQAIAGVIYYDLRARREGLGIDLKLKKDRKPRL